MVVSELWYYADNTRNASGSVNAGDARIHKSMEKLVYSRTDKTHTRVSGA